jgi:hypothetical protein
MNMTISQRTRAYLTALCFLLAAVTLPSLMQSGAVQAQ